MSLDRVYEEQAITELVGEIERFCAQPNDPGEILIYFQTCRPERSTPTSVLALVERLAIVTQRLRSIRPAYDAMKKNPEARCFFEPEVFALRSFCVALSREAQRRA